MTKNFYHPNTDDMEGRKRFSPFDMEESAFVQQTHHQQARPLLMLSQQQHRPPTNSLEFRSYFNQLLRPQDSERHNNTGDLGNWSQEDDLLKEIFRREENFMCKDPHYLENVQGNEITADMRQMLADWLFEVKEK